MDADTNVWSVFQSDQLTLIKSVNSISLASCTESNLGSGVVLSYYFSLASFFLESFHSLSLSFMTLTFLKNTTLPPFNRIVFILCLSAVALWLDWGYAFLAGILYRWCDILRKVHNFWRHMMSFAPYSDVNIDYLAKMLPDFSTV